MTSTIYIPSVFPDVTEEDVRRVFDKICTIDTVSFTTKQNGNNMVHMTVSQYYDRTFARELDNPNYQTRVFYDNDHYWIVRNNSSTTTPSITRNYDNKKRNVKQNKKKVEKQVKESVELVDATYVTMIEAENEKLRNEIKLLQIRNNILEK